MSGKGRQVPRHLRSIISELEARLQDVYGHRFLGLVLFGSQARGTSEVGSDIDIMLLLRDAADGKESRYADLVAELSLKHDVVISLVPMAIEEFQRSKTPLLLNVSERGYKAVSPPGVRVGTPTQPAVQPDAGCLEGPVRLIAAGAG